MKYKTTTHLLAGSVVLQALLVCSGIMSVANATQIDLANLSINDGFVIHGSASGAFAGQSVAPTVDHTQDGYRDLIIAEPGRSQVHIVSAHKPGLAQALDLNNLNGSNGITITGINVGYGSHEKTIATSDNINGVGGNGFAIGGYSGVNVYLGGPPFQTTQSVQQLVANGNVVRLDPNNDFGPFTSVDFYRDFDIDDLYLMMGSRKRPASGKNYWWQMPYPAPNLSQTPGNSNYGSQTPLGDIDGFFWTGNKTARIFGSSQYIGRIEGVGTGVGYFGADRKLGNIAGIGDIDSDGVVDFAVGVQSNAPHKPIAYVVYGRKEWLGEYFPPYLHLPAMTPDQGFAVRVVDNIDSTGYIADSGLFPGVSDVDGDGRSDLVVGSSGVGPNGAAVKSKVYIIFGQPDRSSFGSAVNVTTTNGIDSATIVAATAGDSLGSSVAVSPSSFNSATWDIYIGARTAHVYRPGEAPRFYAGAVYGVFGKPRPW